MKRKKMRVLYPGSLFVKIACVVIAGVLLVSICTLAVSVQTTRQGYIETMSRSNEQIMSMMQAKMESMNDKITDVELAVNTSWAFTQYLRSEKEDVNTFVQVFNMNKQIEAVSTGTSFDIAAIGVNGRSYVGNQSSLSVPVSDLLNSPITNDAREHRNQIIYRYVKDGFTQRSKGSGVFVALKALSYPGSQSIYGFVYVVLKQTDLQAFFNNLSNGTNNLMLLDDSGAIVSAPNNEIVGEKNEELAQTVQNMDETGETRKYSTIDKKDILILTRTMPRWNLHIVSAFDYTQALNDIDESTYVFAISLCVTLFVLAAVFLLIRQITKPIKLLVHTMENVTEKGLPDKIEAVGKGYEVRQLSLAFNVMIDNLNRYVNQLILLEQEKRRMEIHTLQMQINPHFIYNTLTSIKWLIWQENVDTAIQSIDTFTLLIRNTVSDSQSFILTAEETENLKNYCFLQKIRFGQQIQTNIYLNPSAANCRIPKLLLQPFLENSFFHAFTNRQQGVISVIIDCHGENLVCEVIDDGVGMPQSQADALLDGKPNDRGHSIGIPNVISRIHLLFGERYGVKIYSEPGCGTTIKVTLPVIHDENSDEESANIQRKC